MLPCGWIETFPANIGRLLVETQPGAANNSYNRVTIEWKCRQIRRSGSHIPICGFHGRIGRDGLFLTLSKEQRFFKEQKNFLHLVLLEAVTGILL